MRNSSKFIYIVFSVTAMCCKISLHGMHGRATKSAFKYPALKMVHNCCISQKTDIDKNTRQRVRKTRYPYIQCLSMQMLYFRQWRCGFAHGNCCIFVQICTFDFMVQIQSIKNIFKTKIHQKTCQRLERFEVVVVYIFCSISFWPCTCKNAGKAFMLTV